MFSFKNTLFYMTVLFFIFGCSSSKVHKVVKLKRVDRTDSLIVIDAGHGGHDSGAIGAGLYEKNLVLNIARKTALKFKEMGYRVHLTRNSDRFIRLSGRTKIADRKDAKVFISIHANAIANRNRFSQVEGIETYFLQKTRDARSQRIAARENQAVLQGADALSKNVIIDSVLNGPKIIESNKLAIDVQGHIMSQVRHLYGDVKNGGARPAPFYVLVGASRPSILVEVGYITNPKERERLFRDDYQDCIAEGIVIGTTRYIDNRKKEMGF
jgi:N-acetylmuramoyl-L-alanine amidase